MASTAFLYYALHLTNLHEARWDDRFGNQGISALIGVHAIGAIAVAKAAAVEQQRANVHNRHIKFSTQFEKFMTKLLVPIAELVDIPT